jgi:hypothetical protein
MKYTVYVECLGGDEQLVSDVKTGETMGYDPYQDNVKPHWFDTLEEAREFVEFSDEYIQDEDGRLDKDGNWYGNGKLCSDCMGRGHGSEMVDGHLVEDKCEECDGIGEIEHLLIKMMSENSQKDRDMIATLKHELSNPSA